MAGIILHFFVVFMGYRCFYGHTKFWELYYFLSYFIGGPLPFIWLVEILAVILGFCSWEDTSLHSSSSNSSSSNSSSRRPKLYLNSREDIIFHVEMYEVFHGGGDGYYWTSITGELCYQCGIITQVRGQGRASTEQLAYMQARDDYEQNLEQAKQEARIRLRR